MSLVLVLDGRSRAALQIVRSLGEKGIKVIIGNDYWICSSFFSKYVYRRILYPDPKSIKFKKFIFSFLKNNKIDTIIPVRDDTTIFCAKYKKELSKFTNLIISDYETIMIGRDKSKTVIEAEKYGVPCPKTTTVKSKKELLNTNIPFPLVLKPAISSGSRGIYIIYNHIALRGVADKIFKEYDKYLVQEFIPSKKTVGVNVLFDDQNNLKAIFTYTRLREYPRYGGPSVLRESTHDEEVKKLALRLFKKLRWKGVAMAEFKIDERDNVPKLMEINPRFWGSLALPIYAGVDFPFLLYQLVKGKDVKKVDTYKIGVKARWLLLGDLLWLIKSKNITKDFKEFIKIFDKKQTYDIISIFDPLPSIGAILEGFQFIFNPEKRKHAFKRGAISN